MPRCKGLCRGTGVISVLTVLAFTTERHSMAMQHGCRSVLPTGTGRQVPSSHETADRKKALQVSGQG